MNAKDVAGLVVVGTCMAMALTAVGVAACSGPHGTPQMGATAPLPPRTPDVPAEVTAARVEAAISKSDPGGVWAQETAPNGSAYRTDTYTHGQGAASVNVFLYHSMDSAVAEYPEISGDAWFKAYLDHAVVVGVVSGASSQTIAAVEVAER